jgi:hypothetical protein
MYPFKIDHFFRIIRLIAIGLAILFLGIASIANASWFDVELNVSELMQFRHEMEERHKRDEEYKEMHALKMVEVSHQADLTQRDIMSSVREMGNYSRDNDRAESGCSGTMDKGHD